MHWSQIWEGKAPGPRLIRWFLTPGSWLYGLGWQSYLAVYRLGLKKAYQARIPVLCVGNLTVGGMGKTPFVVALVQLLRDEGVQVVIGCSGYGSPAAQGACRAPEGSLHARQWGDEAALLRMELPDTPLIVGRDRVRAAKICESEFPESVLVMDDGLQHLPLGKDVSICLADRKSANRSCLPAGPYREPFRNENRFQILIPDQYSFNYTPLAFSNGGAPVAEPPLSANALCALGQPEQFFRSLESAGISLVHRSALPDHDALDSPQLFESFEPEIPLIVTLKDWVKISDRPDLGQRLILVARRTAVIEKGSLLVQEILNRIHEKPFDTSNRH